MILISQKRRKLSNMIQHLFLFDRGGKLLCKIEGGFKNSEVLNAMKQKNSSRITAEKLIFKYANVQNRRKKS